MKLKFSLIFVLDFLGAFDYKAWFRFFIHKSLLQTLHPADLTVQQSIQLRQQDQLLYAQRQRKSSNQLR